MKVCVVKNGVETEIPNVDVETDAEADKAVKKYLQENNLKKKKAAKFKLHVGLVNQKTVIQFKLQIKVQVLKKGGKKVKKTTENAQDILVDKYIQVYIKFGVI